MKGKAHDAPFIRRRNRKLRNNRNASLPQLFLQQIPNGHLSQFGHTHRTIHP